MFLGIGQPTEEVELATTNYWKFVYGMPIALIALQVFLLTVVHTEDTLNFHAERG
jgi:hypothetical protein